MAWEVVDTFKSKGKPRILNESLVYVKIQSESKDKKREKALWFIISKKMCASLGITKETGVSLAFENQECVLKVSRGSGREGARIYEDKARVLFFKFKVPTKSLNSLYVVDEACEPLFDNKDMSLLIKLHKRLYTKKEGTNGNGH